MGQRQVKAVTGAVDNGHIVQCFFHNVIVKFGHGIGTAVDERWCLVFDVWRHAIRAKTGHHVSSVILSLLLSSVSALSTGLRNDSKSATRYIGTGCCFMN